MTRSQPVAPAQQPLGPELPVVMVHFEAPRWCVESVASILQSRGVQPRITVVDNGGLTVDLDERVRVVRLGRNVGYAGGANVGLAEWLRSPHPFCVVCSHDVVVAPDCLQELFRQANANPRFGVLGPAGLPPRRECRHESDLVLDVPWVSGTLLLLRRSCVIETGPFDERFHAYVEDVEYCLRARDHHWQVGVVRNATASHRGSASSAAQARTTANRLLLKAIRTTGAGRFRVQGKMVGVSMKATLRVVLWRMRGRNVEEARRRRSAWIAATRGSLRRRRSKVSWSE